MTEKCTAPYQLIYMGYYGPFYNKLQKNVKEKLGWINWEERYEIITTPELISYAIDAANAARQGYILNGKVQNGLMGLKALDREYPRLIDGQIFTESIPPEKKEQLIEKYISLLPAGSEAEVAKMLAENLAKRAITI